MTRNPGPVIRSTQRMAADGHKRPLVSPQLEWIHMVRVVIAIGLLSSFAVGAEECDPPDNSTHFVRAHGVGSYRGEPIDSDSDDLFIGAKADSARFFA